MGRVIAIVWLVGAAGCGFSRTCAGAACSDGGAPDLAALLDGGGAPDLANALTGPSTLSAADLRAGGRVAGSFTGTIKGGNAASPLTVPFNGDFDATFPP